MEAKNPEVIRSMFAKVATNYDKANSILSLGIHNLWRKKLVSLANVNNETSVLDCATGTGDLAIEFKKAIGPKGHVVGTDFCPEMLSGAPAKSKKLGLEIIWQQADVMNLPFADNSFDVVSISFGIRNVSDAKKAIAEMSRVLKPDGQLFILEFGQAHMPVFAPVFNFYSEKILPVLGGLVTGQKSAYKYLQKSSAEFPCQQDFITLMKTSANFSKIDFHSLTGGIAYIYHGRISKFS